MKVRRILFAAAVLLALCLRAPEAADTPGKASASRQARLRYEVANLEDLRDRLSAERGQTRGLWGRIVLTREILKVEAELGRVRTALEKSGGGRPG